MLKLFKRLLLCCALFVEFVIAFGVFYVCFATLLSVIPVSGSDANSGMKIFIKSNGIHTDICVPVTSSEIDWKKFIPVEDFPQVRKHEYISFGWGDKGFFLDTPTWDDLTFTTFFNAAFLPSETAMHVQYLENTPVLSPDCKEKFISSENYKALVEYIRTSFSINSDNQVDLIPERGYWSNDNFYEANGSYHLFNTCNAWTNGALKVAGVKTALLALFQDGIMRHL
ncbi:MAG: TIGR02117 family protein [Crocinitomicaceae bacterium]|nr:TIGR02117 family protein [Crocinitomicaceae bacterium]